MELRANLLRVFYGRKLVLEIDKLNFQSGITMLLGANGTGKTSLLKALYGLNRFNGKLYFDKNIITKNFIVKNVSYLSQNLNCHSNLSVLEVVLLGLYSELSLLNNKKYIDIAFDILHKLGIEKLASKNIGQLSGGQRKLAFLGQALMKNPKILLLDEPCNSLDIHNQLKFYDYLTKLENKIVIVAEHDINLSMRYGKQIILLNNGKKLWSGKSNKMNSTLVSNLYEINALDFYIKDTKQFFFKKI